MILPEDAPIDVLTVLFLHCCCAYDHGVFAMARKEKMDIENPTRPRASVPATRITDTNTVKAHDVVAKSHGRYTCNAAVQTTSDVTACSFELRALEFHDVATTCIALN
eukprot:gnl/MRDRNA2_/MRDRNA2_82112_c0_seq1.p1 gnl/MRDRNA2_/MRDRNA2_82112_c0~~gnl/MRDRNA2_/MRDRNA2_82112_c0_seq1.p1  ORF type:complete len:108 (-),score=4.51 gnl/MRDRNA2_/MRDRNA2_82112_c0_seq1:46-369(-)